MAGMVGRCSLSAASIRREAKAQGCAKASPDLRFAAFPILHRQSFPPIEFVVEALPGDLESETVLNSRVKLCATSGRASSCWALSGHET